MQDRGSTLPPCLNRMYLHRQLGAKVCRKVFKFICLPICLRFGRYRPLGKAQSHLQGGPPTRYRNKANLNAKRSAKQLQWQKPVERFAVLRFCRVLPNARLQSDVLDSVLISSVTLISKWKLLYRQLGRGESTNASLKIC